MKVIEAFFYEVDKPPVQQSRPRFANAGFLVVDTGVGGEPVVTLLMRPILHRLKKETSDAAASMLGFHPKVLDIKESKIESVLGKVFQA